MNNKPVSYTITKIFGGYRITFLNGMGYATDAIETRGNKTRAIQQAELILELNK